MEGLAKGLKIKRPYSQLLLVHQLIESGATPKPEASLLLKAAREKVLHHSSKKKMNSLPEHKNWDKVFASLGSLEKGSSLKEIASRCAYPPEACTEVLQGLIQAGAVRFDETKKKFYPLALQSIFEDRTQNTIDYLTQSFEEVAKSVAGQYERTDLALYRLFVFSSKSDRYPELRERLKQLVIEFAEEAEVPEGDQVMRLMVSFQHY
jgi:hypothetical protein